MSHNITGLGYIGLKVSDFEGWDKLLTSVFALEPRHAGGFRQYRMDGWKQRISLHTGVGDGIAHIGWEIPGRQAADALGERLDAAGLETGALPQDVCMERAVLGGLWFTDPVMGVRHELFYGPTILSEQFTPSRPMQGYVTGIQGMGHVVLMTSRQEEAVEFFTKVLDFNVSDVMDFGGEQWGGHFRNVFLHCNSRHHSLAIMSPPTGGAEGQLNHLALTVRSFDDVGYAYDVVHRERIPVLMTLGKHVNDLATSFYVGTPSQSAIEMAYGGISIEKNWSVKHYDTTKIWGHHLYLPPRPLA